MKHLYEVRPRKDKRGVLLIFILDKHSSSNRSVCREVQHDHNPNGMIPYRASKASYANNNQR